MLSPSASLEVEHHAMPWARRDEYRADGELHHSVDKPCGGDSVRWPAPRHNRIDRAQQPEHTDERPEGRRHYDEVEPHYHECRDDDGAFAARTNPRDCDHERDDLEHDREYE